MTSELSRCKGHTGRFTEFFFRRYALTLCDKYITHYITRFTPYVVSSLTGRVARVQKAAVRGQLRRAGEYEEASLGP
jgi:hypothetical protein